MKIAKFLADCGIGSRRRCEQLVASGKVQINGVCITNVAERVDPEKDVVKFAGKHVRPVRKAIFALHKPRGYVSTLSDPYANLTIAELIPARYNWLGLKPVGRLDRESEGLMLLTNDGELANRLMHPRFDVPKVYRATLDKPAQGRILGVIRRGVRLPGEGKLRPVGVQVIGRGRDAAKVLELTLLEGRKREIRRLFEMFGYKVLKVQRIAIGPIKLGRIKKGHMIKLTEAQVNRLHKVCGLEAKK